MVNNLAADMLVKIAPRIGARVIREPKWGVVGQIRFASGRKRYFRYSTLDINRMGASEIARDKDYSKFFMKGMGYPVIRGKAFCTEKWAAQIGSRESTLAAYSFARRLGWPVIVKPNSLSQGRCVTKVHSRNEFMDTFRRISKVDRMILVETFVSGHDYRLVVLDNRVISAYERIPLSVVGDGRSTIRRLLELKQRRFKKEGRDTILKSDDPRIAVRLARQGMSLRSRPLRGQKVYLLDSANLSSGGDSRDVTKVVHPDVLKLAINLTRDMGLRLCGVDLILADDITKKPLTGKYWIIEINSAPGLDHYAAIGKIQQRVVEELYLEVLKAMDTDK
jgi:D-alanine-D-alanine ligase-like ATP-grasp enzyme